MPAMLKPITVTGGTLATDTNRTGFMGTVGWKTSELKAVITALNGFHSGKTTPQANLLEGVLMTAIVTWRTKQPNEFAKRDRISGGLCTKLAIEAGVGELRDNTIKSVRLIGKRQDHPTARQIPTAVCNTVTVPDDMEALSREGTLGVILIDVQADGGTGIRVRWDGTTTVLENMCAVLDKANTLNVPIMEYWMAQNDGPALTIGDLSRKLRDRPNVTTERKPTHNAFDETGLADWLTRTGITWAVVMGYNANQCVGATVFGALSRGGYEGGRRVVDKVTGAATYEGGKFVQNYIPGLLDRGVNVLTSRGILASGDSPLSASEGWPYMGPCHKI